MTTRTATPVLSLITLDDHGVARIAGTRMKVLHIAEERVARRVTPEQMLEAWPHLTLAQIHAALSYYYEHQSAFDEEMQFHLKEYEHELARARAEGSPIRDLLRQRGNAE